MLNPKCAIYYLIVRKAMSSFAGMCAAVRGGTNRRGEEGVPLPCFRKFGLELFPLLGDLAYTFLPLWGNSQGYIFLGLR